MENFGFIYIILIIAIFYFFIIRPQSKKQKQRKEMLEALKKGDDVITIGGIHGKIVGEKNDGNVFIIKVDDNVKLNVDRTAVSHLQGAALPV